MKHQYLRILLFLISVTAMAGTGKDTITNPVPATSNPLVTPATQSLDAIALQKLELFKTKRLANAQKKQEVLRQYSAQEFRTFEQLSSPTATTAIPGWLDGLAEFTDEYLKKVIKRSPKEDTLINKAKKVLAMIEQQDKFINIMSGEQLLEFPVGIKKSFSKNASITIGIIKAKLHANYAEVDLFAKLESGQFKEDLFFGASGVKISHDGGIYSEAKLSLLGNFPIALNGGQWLLTLKGGYNEDGSVTDQTYVTIDCFGKVQEMRLDADIRIAKTVATPVKEDGTSLPAQDKKPQGDKSPVGNTTYVGASFKFEASSLDDLLINVDLPKFELAEKEGWAFEMRNAVLDLSDTRNSDVVKFPPIYEEQQLIIPGQENLWRGFYSDKIAVTLPPEFSVNDSDKRTTFLAKGLLIDNFGVSGNFYGHDVIHINDGNASKWQYSLDTIHVDLQVNKFVQADFYGKIVLPVSQADDEGNGALVYKGLITADDHYIVRADVTQDLDFSIFKGSAKLYRESYIKMEVDKGKFYPEAQLTGVMAFNKEQNAALDDISSDSSKGGGIESFEFEGLAFQDFRIQTRKRPYLSIKYMGFKDTIALPKISGFELGFYDISAKVYEDDRAEIGFNAYVNLDESGIHGDIGLRILGKLEDGDYPKWKFDKIEVDEIEVDVKRKNFEFYGRLEFFRENPLYGNGLTGELRLKAESLKIELEAKGIFGTVDGYRYWYVDAFGRPTSNDSNKNIKIYDIGGGVYHHMRKAGMDERAESLSGIYYRPDKRTSLGFKAMAAFGVKKSFTGLFAIEMSFNSKSAGGGISRIGFYGGAAMMASEGGGGDGGAFGTVDGMQKQLAEKEQSIPNFHKMSIDKEGIKFFATEVFPNILTGKEKFAAQLAIDFDFRNDTYWGMFDVFLNMGQIKGAGEKNRLGYIEFYDAPDDWYIYIGTPTKRFGVAGIPIGPFDASFDLYFMTGTILPDPAQPKPEVIDILNLKGDELLFGRNFNSQLAQGTGYAFGAYVEIGKSFDWGIIYASVRAGVGFDLMIKDFGDAHCKGKAGPLGMDGWYATGQLYSFLQGEIGAQIKIFGKRKKVPILKAGVAVLAQGQLPNPWFVKGYAGVKVRVLGLITVSARLTVTIGEECEIVGKSGLQDVVIISDISPEDNSKKVDVFEAVQVAFNVPIGQTVELMEESGTKKYQVQLKEITVKDGNTEIIGTLEWNTTKDILVFDSREVLPPEKKITATVKVQFNEFKTGKWTPVLSDGQPIVETKTTSFTTGKAPTRIPYKNIEHMYPIVNQRYMLPKESKVGHIQLEKGQEYLFGTPGYRDELFFITESGKMIPAEFSYNATNDLLTFKIPNLPNETKISYALVTSKVGLKKASPSELKEVFTNSEDGVSMTQNTLSGSATNDARLSRLDFAFETSRYNTFKAKVKSMNIEDNYNFMDGASNVSMLELRMAPNEPYDINEVIGTIYTQNQPLISGTGLKTDYYWNEEIYPLLYKEYPLDKNIRVIRSDNGLGVPPMNNIKPTVFYTTYLKNNPESSYLKEHFPFRWKLAAAYKSDYVHLQYTIVNRYYNEETIDAAMYEKYKYIMNGAFPYINVEDYEVNFKYTLPGKTSGNSVKVKYKNNF